MMQIEHILKQYAFDAFKKHLIEFMLEDAEYWLDRVWGEIRLDDERWLTRMSVKHFLNDAVGESLIIISSSVLPRVNESDFIFYDSEAGPAFLIVPPGCARYWDRRFLSTPPDFEPFPPTPSGWDQTPPLSIQR